MAKQIKLTRRRWTEYQITERDDEECNTDCDFADTLEQARAIAARGAANDWCTHITIERVKHSAMENDEYQIQRDHDMEYELVDTICIKTTEDQ